MQIGSPFLQCVQEDLGMSFVRFGSYSEYARYIVRGGLNVLLVGENRFESSLRLTSLIRRFRDLDVRPPGARMGSDVAIHSITSGR